MTRLIIKFKTLNKQWLSQHTMNGYLQNIYLQTIHFAYGFLLHIKSPRLNFNFKLCTSVHRCGQTELNIFKNEPFLSSKRDATFNTAAQTLEFTQETEKISKSDVLV